MPTLADYQIVERAPTLDEYREICASVGWQDSINFDAASQSLERSLYAVVALHHGQAVGMGRLIGDGAIYFYIQDVAIHPAHQQRGVGQRIVGMLMAYLKTHAPAKAFVGLFATEGHLDFYRQFGFSTHPALTGMFRVAPTE
jgi:ribosomal protein S18 acetylase RimI-like enzyme